MCSASGCNVVRQSGEQLLAVLNDVLDLSKIEAGKLELTEQDFDIERVAQSVRDGFAAIAQDKGLDFTVEVDGAGGGRCGAATPTGCARSSPTWSPTRSSSPTPAG